ncbi:MAG TPA: hypothetical protein VLZ07_03270 [Syntrophales bacterium]|nr:hypothetical protein [Syntrophales bacterium]
MKQKKAGGKENVIDFASLMDRKKMADMVNMDDEEFKKAMTRLILSIVEAMGKNNRRIDESFEILIEHLTNISRELNFLKQVLYMERILDGERRNGSMTIEQKKSLAESFGIDFKKLVQGVSKKRKTPRRLAKS